MTLTGLQGGNRNNNGTFNNIGNNGYWWSSAPYSYYPDFDAFGLILFHDESLVYDDFFWMAGGYSLRCVRD